MKRAINIIILIIAVVAMISCSKKTVFFEYHTLPLEGWNADSIVSFNFAIEDTSLLYDAIISIRYTNRYPYQNMWLFVDEGTVQDTIEFYLADNRGKWLGNGYGNTYEMPVLYLNKQHFHTTDTIQFTICQAMREHILVGVNEIGLKIIQSED